MFKSLIDGHDCTEHHYLVELVMQREAKKRGDTLPSKFWNLDLYKKKYKLQVIAARSLLKIFSIEQILDGLRCKDGNWIYSLQYRNLIDIISTEIKKKEKNSKIIPQVKIPIEVQVEKSETLVRPRTQPKENIMDKLDNIDANLQRHSF